MNLTTLNITPVNLLKHKLLDVYGMAKSLGSKDTLDLTSEGVNPYIIGCMLHVDKKVEANLNIEAMKPISSKAYYTDYNYYTLNTQELHVKGIASKNVHPNLIDEKGELKLPKELDNMFWYSAIIQLITEDFLLGKTISDNIVIDVSKIPLSASMKEMLCKILTQQVEEINVLTVSNGNILTKPNKYKFLLDPNYPGKDFYDYKKLDLIFGEDIVLPSIPVEHESCLTVTGGNGGKDSTANTLIMNSLGYEVKVVDVPKVYDETKEFGYFEDKFLVGEGANYDMESIVGIAITSLIDSGKEELEDSYVYQAQVKTPLMMYSGWLAEFLTNGKNKYRYNLYGGHYAHDYVEEGQTDLIVDEGYMASTIGASFIPSIGPVLGMSEAGIMYLLIKHNPKYRSWRSFRFSCWTYETMLSRGVSVSSDGVEHIGQCEYCEKCNRYKLIIKALRYCGDEEVEDFAEQIVSEFLTEEVFVHAPIDFGNTAFDFTYTNLKNIIKLGDDNNITGARKLWESSNLGINDISDSTALGQGEMFQEIKGALTKLGVNSGFFVRPDMLELQAGTMKTEKEFVDTCLSENYKSCFYYAKDFLSELKKEDSKTFALLKRNVFTPLSYANVYFWLTEFYDRMIDYTSFEAYTPFHVFTKEGYKTLDNEAHTYVYNILSERGCVKSLEKLTLLCTAMENNFAKVSDNKSFNAIFKNSNYEGKDKDMLMDHYKSHITSVKKKV